MYGCLCRERKHIVNLVHRSGSTADDDGDTRL